MVIITNRGIRQFAQLFLLLQFMLIAAWSSAEVYQDEYITVELVSESTELIAGQRHWLAVRLQPREHWHTYWQNPGDSGLQTRIEWQLPAGLTAGEIHWPSPQRIDLGGIINYGFEGEAFLLVPIEVDPDFLADSTDGRVKIKASVSWLVCETICIPGDAELTLELPVKPTSLLTGFSNWKPAFDRAREQWPKTLSGAQASFEVDDAYVWIRLRGLPERVSAADTLNLFPVDLQMIDHSAPQKISHGKNELLIQQKRSPYFQQAVDVLNMVLVVGNGKQSWLLAALPDSQVADGFIASEPPFPLQEQSLWLMLLLAFIGGVILNLMPCVFPILSLKAISLIQLHGKHSREQIEHGFLYALGVVSSFLLIAAILLALRASGESIGWGFQLQSSWFVAALVYLLFLLGLSLSGVFYINVQFMSGSQGRVQHDTRSGSFLTGVLATVVASPCTAPFMGTAMGFAMLQSTAESLLVFFALGLGMAFPFLLLALVPALGRYLPKPGQWMETFKQVMAYPLYLTAIWLLWVLGKQTQMDVVAMVLCGLLLWVMAISFWQIAVKATHAKRWKVLSILLVLLALSVLPWVSRQAALHEAHQSARQFFHETAEPFSLASLQTHRQAGEPVFVNLTADWCITCKVNEKLVLNQQVIQDQLTEQNIVYMVGDWTNRNAEISDFLQQHGRTGVPLYLYYPAEGAEVEILPQLLTTRILLETFNQ